MMGFDEDKVIIGNENLAHRMSGVLLSLVTDVCDIQVMSTGRVQ